MAITYSDTPCSVENCDKSAAAKGMCNAHYFRTRRYGSPHKQKRISNGSVERWMRECLLQETDECIPWPFAMPSGGRPTVRFSHFRTSAARAMCELAHGAPESSKIDAAHLCGNGHLACMNKNHLRWKTRKANCEDTVAHGRSTRGERNTQSKLSECEVVAIFRDSRKSVSIARDYNVSLQTIRSIKRGVRWGWLTEGAA